MIVVKLKLRTLTINHHIKQVACYIVKNIATSMFQGVVSNSFFLQVRILWAVY